MKIKEQNEYLKNLSQEEYEKMIDKQVIDSCVIEGMVIEPAQIQFIELEKR